MGNNTYLCRYKPSDLAKLNGLSYVERAIVYHPEFVVSQQLKQQVGLKQDGTASNAQGKPIQDKISVSVVLHAKTDGTFDQTLDNIKKVTGSEILDTHAPIIRIRTNPLNLQQIASLDSVKTIEQIPSVELASNIARTIMRVDDGNALQPLSAKYQGKGEVIAVADSGLYTHPAFSGRVVDIRNFNQEIINDEEGHGTHVAGCALGDGKSGDQLIRGTAPEAKLFAIAFQYSKELPPNLLELFKLQYRDDQGPKTPKIHNNSWVSIAKADQKIQHTYGEASGKVVDQAMWEDPELLICFSAGNFGRTITDTGSQIGGVSAAKNCITVGATMNQRPMINDDTYDRNGKIGNSNWVPDFSNRGPTMEGRIKPDVVAPGAVILAARSRDKRGADVQGEWPDKDYMFASGTSMSCPFVAGCAAVLRQAIIDMANPAPTGALLKALLVNGTVDIATGNVGIMVKNPMKDPKKENDPPQRVNTIISKAPNSIQGFGLINLETSLKAVVKPLVPDAASPGPFYGFEDHIDLRQGESYARKITTDQVGDLNVTLAWTDPPGEKTQNSFRLTATCKPEAGKELSKTINVGNEWRPYVPEENNVQKLTWQDLPKGIVTLKVDCKRVVDTGRAPFALVWAMQRK